MEWAEVFLCVAVFSVSIVPVAAFDTGDGLALLLGLFLGKQRFLFTLLVQIVLLI